MPSASKPCSNTSRGVTETIMPTPYIKTWYTTNLNSHLVSLTWDTVAQTVTEVWQEHPKAKAAKEKFKMKFAQRAKAKNKQNKSGSKASGSSSK